jgi:hypothetical protein
MKAERAYKAMAEDREIAKRNASYVVLYIDLQQVPFCPTSANSSVFYQRQYASYSMSVHNANMNEVVMCFWHESVAKRGSVEIASCVLKYFTMNYQALPPGEERRHVAWSDRCAGQSNNWCMLPTYQYLISLKLFNKTNKELLVSGHSFLPYDRVFALIERRRKTALVYHPEQWIDVITSSRPSKQFSVLLMESSDFKDLSLLEKSLKKDADLKITSAHWLQL